MPHQRGNIFLGIFAAVALLGLLGTGLSQFIRGPLTNATNINRVNKAEQQMQVAAQLIIGMSATQTAGAGNGDCDSDNFIEPLEYRDPTTNPHPTGGGYIPSSVGATKLDPWGTEYGYCVWDSGATITSDNDATCGGNTAKRLDGAEPSVAHPTKPNTQAIVALVSAGKDKTFDTTCNAFVDANDDAVADTALVVKTSGKDDIILQYTYSEAQAAGGDLWVLKSGDPTTATISKDVEIAANKTLQFANDARLLLPTQVELTDGECTGTAASHVNEQALRLNTTTSPPTLQVCYDSDAGAGYSWAWGSTAGTSGGSIDALSDGIADYVTLYNVFLGDSAGTSTTTGTYNTALGYRALNANVAKSGSTAIGYEAMRYADSGAAATTYNTAVGYQALRGSTTAASNTGTSNVALGHSAMISNTTGSSNVAIGAQTASLNAPLYTNMTAANVIAIGSGALAAETAAQNSVAIGVRALLSSNAGVGYDENVAVGYRALGGNVSPNDNVAIGTLAAGLGTQGEYNVTVGHQAGYRMNGNHNVAVGYQALSSSGVGTSAATSNIAIGSFAMSTNTSGASNTVIGYNALYANVAGNQSTAVGFEAMRYGNSTSSSTTTYNTAVGYQALMGSTTAASNTGTRNTALGHSALKAVTSSSYNVAVGVNALTAHTANGAGTGEHVAIGYNALADTVGGYNGYVAVGAYALKTLNAGYGATAVGYYAGYNNQGAEWTTAIGYRALYNNNTHYNTCVGAQCMYSATGFGQYNAGLGYAAGYANLGGKNTVIGATSFFTSVYGQETVAVGYEALRYADDTTAGLFSTYNTALGAYALRGSTTAASNTGTTNTAVGHSALLANTSGSGNVAVGYNAGNAGTANTTGANNTFVGYQAQANANNYSNGTALGNGAILTASNRIVLGNTSIASIYAQVTTITGISDARRKHDIEDIPLGLDFINALRPVQYRYNNGDETLRYGFIAQETEKALPDRLRPLTQKNSGGLALLARENDKDKTYHMAYGELTAPIVKAIQEQQAEIEALKKERSVTAKSLSSEENLGRIVIWLAGAAFIFAMGALGGAAWTRRQA